MITKMFLGHYRLYTALQYIAEMLNTVQPYFCVFHHFLTMTFIISLQSVVFSSDQKRIDSVTWERHAEINSSVIPGGSHVKLLTKPHVGVGLCAFVCTVLERKACSYFTTMPH